MRNSNAVITDDEESATVSDDDIATTESYADVGSKNDAGELQAPLKSAPFCKGEKVLAYHQRLIYEAKVFKRNWRSIVTDIADIGVGLSITEDDGSVQEVDSTGKLFYVHYQGWNKKWDEWVGMDCLLTHNKENLEKQKTLEKEHPLEKLTKSGRVFLKPKSSNVTRARKRKRISKGAASSQGLIDVRIPSTLKKHLVNYYEYITHMGKVVKLPCFPNVDEILKLYLENQSNKDGRGSDSAVEIISGLRCYFDKALPAMLLYKGERQQYEEATANGISPSKVYGAEHLLRLFVKLPEILYHANIEEETLTELQHKLEDFLKFLEKKESFFFLSTYETPDGSCKME